MHAAFFTFPLHGHVNPTLGVVAELVRRGHRVTFATTPEFADAVKAAGAEPLLYDNVMPKSLDLVIKPPGEVSSEEFHRSIRTITEEGFAPLAQAHDALADDHPDVVLHDLTAFHTGRLLALKWGVPAIRLCTTIAFTDEFNPYLRFLGQHPDIDPTHPAITGEREAVVQALESHGVDLTPEEFRADTSTLRRSLVFLPRELQVGADHFDDDFAFVGPCLTDRAFEDDWKPRQGTDPLVVVAFGTFGYTSQRRLFTECVREFADRPWRVVLVVGNQVDPADLEPLPANVEVRRWVPQLALLAETDVFVSHAGMGSVTEALWTGTPVVLLPQLTEQDLVAEQVTGLGLGRVVPRDNLGAKPVGEAVAELLAALQDGDLPARLTTMREAMRTAGGARRAVDVIEDVIA
ncbi:MGT family glycosyltransferase [Actinokineospora auranticolor]|uniref:MGT family glycosyltransferase n=1 Tax=Actinokineospora auranticolor TaxID=155976 RepID=A0A2S6GTH5_9PSEU|nr:MGT family glycosyltransferase [Actinokineospora auranticolor]